MNKNFHDLIKENDCTPIIGVVSPLVAMLAKKLNFPALYVSGAGLANFEYGLPDLELTTLKNVTQVVRRISDSVDIPILVDADTGWGGPDKVKTATKALSESGASGLHIEDQIFPKRCGHLDGKKLISKEEMSDKIEAAKSVAPKNFLVMARTDALANEGLEAAIERALMYKKAGADAIFFEAVEELESYRQLHNSVNLPLLANITEFGKSPLWKNNELREAGVCFQLHPLSLMRLMMKVAETGLLTYAKTGSFEPLLDQMQTRKELYELLDYESFASGK